MSLRIRLSIIVSLLCLAGMTLGTIYLVGNAKQRVADEVNSSATLAYQLITAMLSVTDSQIDESFLPDFLENLVQVEDARHLDINLAQEADSEVQSSDQRQPVSAPAWFANSVWPEPLEYRIALGGNSGEHVQIRANPTDEIEEAWAESKDFMLVLALVLVALNGILFLVIGRWFQPVNDILRGLDQVEHGHFNNLDTDTSLPELRVIKEKVNSLAKVLEMAQQENRELAKKSLHIQEQERKNLAQELHDDMGQSISAIKAIAFSIRQRGDTEKGAEKIEAISSDIHQHLRSMMSKLRPTTLDELGLIPALQNMVDEWNDNHNETFCSIAISDKIERTNADFKINIYRIVQEALTNVARHSRATRVDISLQSKQRFELSIVDNGVGFEIDKTKTGLGIPGIRERAQVLGGQCEITSKPEAGTRIEISFEAVRNGEL